MNYTNFSLKIEPRDGENGYRVLLIDSPIGQDGSFFNPDAAEEAFAQPLALLREIWCCPRTVESRSGFSAGTSESKVWWPTAQRFGDSLFQALFTPAMKAHLNHSLGLVQERHAGLRIRLHFDPRLPQLADLLCLPWEFLFDANTYRYLNLDLRSPVIRYLDIPKPSTPTALPPPLRILLAWSQPSDMLSLKLNREIESIGKALKLLDGVEVHLLGHATWESLRQKLRESRFHALHFMGHGGMDETCGREGLFLEDSSGKARFINAQQLTACLSGLGGLHFVFLNACQYALLRDTNQPHPFSTLATALLLEGIPAVLAMQAPIADLAAFQLATLFYQRIAKGEPIETALTEARLGVFSQNTSALDWAAPVLYLRTAHGQLFPQQGQPQAIESPTQTTAHKRVLAVFLPVALVLILFSLWLGSMNGAPPPLRLRSIADRALSSQRLQSMLITRGFFDAGLHPQGKGLANRYSDLAAIITDSATQLSWQKNGSRNMLTLTQGQDYIDQLNQKRFAGFADWRLPTLEEALSLMEAQVQDATNFIDPVFNSRQFMILTSDTNALASPWIVSFKEGRSAAGPNLSKGYVRAVRSLP